MEEFLFAIEDVEEQVQALAVDGSSSVDDDDRHVSSTRNVVEVIKKLIVRAESSRATVVTDLVEELKDELNKFRELTSISVCTEFKKTIKSIVKNNEYLKSVDLNDYIKTIKSDIVHAATKFVAECEQAPLAIAQYSRTHDFNNQIILVHGFSVAVLDVLKTAAHEDQKVFEVLCTEGMPENNGLKMVEHLTELGIPVKLIPASSVASSMAAITMVLVGADGIMRNGGGGIISQMGTNQIAMIARNMNKPLYVAAESFKISSCPCPTSPTGFRSALFSDTDIGVPVATQDYTSLEHILEFWTDLGIFSPTEACANLVIRV